MKTLDYDGLDHVVDKIYDLINSGGSADYIVEQGTSGIWTYRKWASGIAECWGQQTYPSAKFTQAYAFYYRQLGSVSYPTGLFIEPPMLQITIGHNSLATGGTGFETNTKDGFGTVAIAQIDVARDVRAFFNARGFWKEFTPSSTGSTYSPIDLRALNANALQYKKCSALNITNTNNLLSNGIYSGYSMTNAPQTGWMLYLVLLHDNNSNYVEQIAFPIGSPAKFWRRTLNGANNWSAWNVYNQN